LERGYVYDLASELVYLRARYYDPSTAQFISRDPAVAMTRHPYAYVGDNPLNGTDPSGLCDWWDVGCHVNEVHQWASQNTAVLESTAQLADTASEVMSGVAYACGIGAVVFSETGVGAVAGGACAATAAGLAIGSSAAAAGLHGLAAWGESDPTRASNEYQSAVIDAGSIPLSFLGGKAIASCAPNEGLAKLGEMAGDASTGLWAKLQRAANGLQ
jgi:RHS repeat-associated protein